MHPVDEQGRVPGLQAQGRLEKLQRGRERERNVSVTQHLAHIKTWSEKKKKTSRLQLSASLRSPGGRRQGWPSRESLILYNLRRAVTTKRRRHASAPPDRRRQLSLKICLFRVITAQNADLIIRGRMRAAAECVFVCFLCDRQSHWAQSNLITGRQKRQLNHTPDTAITRRHD